MWCLIVQSSSLSQMWKCLSHNPSAISPECAPINSVQCTPSTDAVGTCRSSEHACGAPTLFLSAEERGSNGNRGLVPLLKGSQSREGVRKWADEWHAVCILWEIGVARCWEITRKRENPNLCFRERGRAPQAGQPQWEVRRGASGQGATAAGAAGASGSCRRALAETQPGCQPDQIMQGVPRWWWTLQSPSLENLLLCPPAERVKTSLWLLSLNLTSTHLLKLNCLVFDIFLTTYLDLNTFSIKTVCNQCVLPNRW